MDIPTTVADTAELRDLVHRNELELHTARKDLWALRRFLGLRVTEYVAGCGVDPAKTAEVTATLDRSLAAVDEQARLLQVALGRVADATDEAVAVVNSATSKRFTINS